MMDLEDLPDQRLIPLLRRVRMTSDETSQILIMKEIAQLLGQARRQLCAPDATAGMSAYGLWVKWLFYVAGYTRKQIIALRDQFASAPAEQS